MAQATGPPGHRGPAGMFCAALQAPEPWVLMQPSLTFGIKDRHAHLEEEGALAGILVPGLESSPS